MGNGLRHRFAREDGMSLIEIVVVGFVVAVALSAIAHLSTSVMLGSMRSRMRQTAVALANEQIENIRGTSYGNIMMKAGTTPAPPTTFTDDGGVTYSASATTPPPSDGSKASLLTAASPADCPDCIEFQPAPVTSGGHSFTLARVVLAVDDPNDELAPDDTHPIDYKRAIVQVTSENPSFTYTAQTIVHDVATDPVVDVQGLRIEVRDGSTEGGEEHDWDGDPATTNDVVVDDSFEWSVSIPEAGVIDAPTEEGVYSNFALETGVYTVTLENTDASKDWYPEGSPLATSETFSCTVGAGQVATCSRDWIEREVCLVDPAKTGRLWIRVLGSDVLVPEGVPLAGVGLSGAGIDPLSNAIPAGTTGELGDKVWSDPLPVGPYSITASLLGYQPLTQTGCVAEQESDEPNLTFVLTPVTVGVTSSADISVTYTGGGNQTFVVKLIGSTGYEQQQSMSKNDEKVFHFTPLLGTYRVEVSCLKKGVPNLKDALDDQAVFLTPAYAHAFTVKKC